MRAVVLAVLVAAGGCGKAAPTTESNSAPATPPPSTPESRAAEAKGGEVRSHIVGHLTVTVVPIEATLFAVFVTTKDDTKNAQFKAWSFDVAFSLDDVIPPMEDELGNRYPAVRTKARVDVYFSPANPCRLHRDFAKTLPKRFEQGSGSVTSALARCDAMAYQDLAPKAKRMILTLPAKNIGGTGMLRFVLDRDKAAEQLAAKD